MNKAMSDYDPSHDAAHVADVDELGGGEVGGDGPGGHVGVDVQRRVGVVHADGGHDRDASTSAPPAPRP